MENELMSLPMVALRGLTVLPEQVTHFDVSREKSVQAITQAMKKDQKIFLVMQKEIEVEEPKESDLYRIGCIATVVPRNLQGIFFLLLHRLPAVWARLGFVGDFFSAFGALNQCHCVSILSLFEAFALAVVLIITQLNNKVNTKSLYITTHLSNNI